MKLIRQTGVVFCALFIVGCGDGSSPSQGTAVAEPVLSLSVVRRMATQIDVAAPLAYEGGLVVADEAGGIARLDSGLKELWRVQLEGCRFSSSGVADGGSLYMGSAEGTVLRLDPVNGSPLWKRAFDAAFPHAPLAGMIGERRVLWLLSGEDGRIFCLDAESGDMVWQGEETNRSDGGMVLSGDLLAYGNCDGAVHLFSANDGTRVASVPVGDADQMAATPLVRADGILIAGTRGGKLVAVNTATRELVSSMTVSEQEAFTVPVRAFGDLFAMGTAEGEVLLCSRVEELGVVKRMKTAGAVEHLAFDGELLYALSEGTVMALDQNLAVKASLNVADHAEGLTALGGGRFAVNADGSILVVKGIWK